MRSHELAELLLSQPDREVVASVDIDDDGKVFGKSICDVFEGNRDEIIVHFELSETQGKIQD